MTSLETEGTGVVPDAINALLGAETAARLTELRSRRPVTRDQSQASYLALFQPASVADVSLAERAAIAVFVAQLHQNAAAVDFYAAHASQSAELLDAVRAAATAGSTEGPYGDYREPGLASESTPGLRFSVSAELTEALGERLAAALEHTHLLVFRPRESTAGALQKLLDAGWSTTGIVTISQLVSFLAYQLRVATGLGVLAERAAAVSAAASTTA